MEKPNLIFFEKLSKGDSEFMSRLIKTLKEDFKEDQIAYVKANQELNFDQMKFYVHRIKHKIGILGLEKSYILVGNYENDLSQENLNLKNDFLEILKTVSSFLKKL